MPSAICSHLPLARGRDGLGGRGGSHPGRASSVTLWLLRSEHLLCYLSPALPFPLRAIHCVSVCQPHVGGRLLPSRHGGRGRARQKRSVLLSQENVGSRLSGSRKQGGSPEPSGERAQTHARLAGRRESGLCQPLTAPPARVRSQDSGPSFPGAPEGVVDGALEAPLPFLEGHQELPVPSPSKTGHGTQITALGQDTFLSVPDATGKRPSLKRRGYQKGLHPSPEPVSRKAGALCLCRGVAVGDSGRWWEGSATLSLSESVEPLRSTRRFCASR